MAYLPVDFTAKTAPSFTSILFAPPFPVGFASATPTGLAQTIIPLANNMLPAPPQTSGGSGGGGSVGYPH